MRRNLFHVQLKFTEIPFCRQELVQVFQEKQKDWMVTLTNHTDSPQKIKNCAITGVDVDQSFLETDHLKVIFPGGIQIGSTKEEVIEAYGMCEEENIYEDEYEEQYTWYAPDTFWNNCDISFDIDTGTVSNMSLEKNE